jgi:hypothetical protein
MKRLRVADCRHSDRAVVRDVDCRGKSITAGTVQHARRPNSSLTCSSSRPQRAETTALLSVGNTPEDNDTYQMVGIPDGLGVLPGRATPWGSYVDEDEYITVFMNHELGATAGGVRAHGQTGAFVSEWTLRLDDLAVESGRDLIRNVYLWNGAAHVFSNGLVTTQFGRFCSADLPPATAFYNPASGKGYPGRMFLNGEEAGNEGRAFAHIISGFEKGSSYQLPFLGRMSYENVLANGHSGDKTVVIGTDDSTPGQGISTPVISSQSARRFSAGLEGGKLFGIRVTSGGVNYRRRSRSRATGHQRTLISWMSRTWPPTPARCCRRRAGHAASPSSLGLRTGTGIPRIPTSSTS